MIKCIRIDVVNEVIHEVEINDNIQDIYKQLDCDLFEVVRLDNTNDLYVDEEGLLKVNDNTKFFQIDGYPQPLVGNGLIMGHKSNGDTISTTLDIQDIKEKVKFLTLNDVRYKEYYQ